MVGSIADTRSIEFKVDVRLSYATLHEELHTAILMDIVTIPRRQRAEILPIHHIGDIEGVIVIA